MSESYDHKGVTITPQGGGYYDLTHPSLPDGKERVRGKETAETRADAIAAAFAPDDGEAHIAPQGDLTAAPVPPVVVEPAAPVVTTVVTDGGEAPEPAEAQPAVVPRSFSGVLPDDFKKTMEKAGVTFTRIILEESPDIPPTGLYLGHNGKGYMISPGEEVDVPDFLLGILDDAVMSQPVVDMKTQKVLGYRSRMRYPYRKV